MSGTAPAPRRGPIGASTPPRHHRERRPEDLERPHPLYAVWEITLRCDLGCKHCGSRAGHARDGELDTAAALATVRELADLGVREVTLIGGEAYLREDWGVIARAITDAGMACGITTGARNLTDERIRRAVDAGVKTVSVSIDGLERTHDAQRNVPGAFQAAASAVERLSKTPIRVGTNTQINRLSLPELPALARRLALLGTRAWQIQLTVPMGHAADRPRLLLEPWELLLLYPLLVQIDRDILEPAGVVLYPGNNIGYFTPFEGALRYGGERGVHWSGCPAGEWSIGLEADGKIKACPSLPSAKYTGGYLGATPLAEAVQKSQQIAFIRQRTREDLWGFCRSCYYADVCKAGCTWTAEVFFGRPGNNPYCIHRAMELEKRGIRETLELVAPAPGVPFDQGKFRVVESGLDGAATTLSGFDVEACWSLDPAGPGIWTEAAMQDILQAKVERKRTPLRVLG